MLQNAIKNKLHYTLRFAAAMCFIGHGMFGIITKPVWFNYFAVFGIGHSLAQQLMPLLGVVDVMMGISLLLFPTRAVLLWLVIWGFITATLRPLSGEPFAEVLERAGNYGAPLVMLLLHKTKIKNIGQYFSNTSPDNYSSEVNIKTIILCLRIAIFLLLAGHGWLNIIEKKSLLSQYAGLCFSNPALLARFTGWFEMLAAFSVLIKPVRNFIITLLCWKIATELFYPHMEVFEWIERGGSYGCLLALWFAMPAGNAIKTLSNYKITKLSST
jgi:hypothetical protein